jgi:hypothetical protein
MRKIAICLVCSAFCFSAFAEGEETLLSVVPDAPSYEEAKEHAVESVQKKSWRERMQGWQVGVGVPLMVPLSGYNGFVGYMNKKAESWIWRRVGGRLDFQIPVAIKADGVLNCANADDPCPEYDVNAKLGLMGFNFNFDKVAKVDGMKFDSDDLNEGDEVDVNLEGATAGIRIKNQNIGALVDIYPFGNTWFLGGLRLSGGYYIGKLSMEIAGNIPNYVPNDTGVSFDIVENSLDKLYVRAKASRVKGALNWKYSGPYLGAGFDLGVFRGFKFYMDAGVVFTNAPRLSDRDFSDPIKETGLQICYSVGGLLTACVVDKWKNVKVNNVSEAVGGLLGDVIAGIANGHTPIPGFTDDPAKLAAFEAALSGYLDGGNYNAAGIGADVSAWLEHGTPPSWFDKLPDDMKDAIADIQDELDLQSGFGDKMQAKVDEMLVDYYDARRDAIDDANDGLKDFKFVPMVKLGVMFRF